MTDILAGSPLLTLFLTITLGTALGSLKVGPVRLGAAGALFVGLLFGALDPRLGEGLTLVQTLGLALFVYMIGLAAGPSIMRDLRKQRPLMLAASLALVVWGGFSLLLARALGIGSDVAGGMFAGMLTATPALQAATDATGGSTAPAVGYAIAYPAGVLVSIVILTAVSKRKLPGRKDPDPDPAGLLAITVAVEKAVAIPDIPEVAEVVGKTGSVRISYLLREGTMRVARPHDHLEVGDHVVVVGVPAAVERTAEFLGHRLSQHLAEDHSVVAHRSYVVSSRAVAGRTVADLHIPSRFNSLITRVQRGDREFLAQPETTVQLGDRLRVVTPKDQDTAVAAFLGDSEKQVNDVNFFALGIGIALGIAVGLVSIPIGPMSFTLGAAAGPLVMGLVLGAIERTNSVVWTIPANANLVIRQMGLILFLACVGLASGEAFASTAFTRDGAVIVGLSVVLVASLLLVLWLVAGLLGLSTSRTAGSLAGVIGQPVLLSHVDRLLDDERTESGYSALFALTMIVKIVAVQALVSL